MEIAIQPMTLSDMAVVLAELDRFWGGRDMRFLHQKVFVQEFGDTCLAARGADGQIAGYLIGFPAPRGLGYIHAVAVRDSARGTGCGQALYQAFAAAAAAHGADRLKAITSVTNTGSVAFHRRLGFDVVRVEDYDGPGKPMMVMTRPLPWTSAPASPESVQTS
jgi:ribosomal protein S18 acetylase RimI-like enzyme